MNKIICDDLETAINLLGPRPPNIEVWVRDYIPSKQVFKVILKDLPNTVKGYLPGTEVIYFISREDLSMGVAKTLQNLGMPVFGPGGERLG